MFGKAVRRLGIFVVLIAVSGLSLTMLMQDASGDFLEILRINKIGIEVGLAAFVPLGLYLLYKSK